MHFLLLLFLLVTRFHSKFLGQALEVELATSLVFNSFSFIKIWDLFHLNCVILICVLTRPGWALPILLRYVHTLPRANVGSPLINLCLWLRQIHCWLVVPRSQWLREELVLPIVTFLLV